MSGNGSLGTYEVGSKLRPYLSVILLSGSTHGLELTSSSSSELIVLLWAWRAGPTS